MLSPTTVLDLYSFEINGSHKIRLDKIKTRHVVAMIVFFTKLKILITFRPVVYNKKEEKRGAPGFASAAM